MYLLTKTVHIFILLLFLPFSYSCQTSVLEIQFTENIYREYKNKNNNKKKGEITHIDISRHIAFCLLTNR